MSEVMNVAEIFGKNVFNETVMKERLPKSVFKKMKKTIEDGAELDPSIADVVAHAMKDWAIERGATHYGEAGSSLFKGYPGPCGSGDPARLHPWLPFLPGRQHLPSAPGTQPGVFKGPRL